MVASAQVDCTGASSGQGDGTYYSYTPGSGRCSLEGDDTAPMVAAMNPVDFVASGICGRWVRVTGPLGSVDVRIVDECPICAVGDIDRVPGPGGYVDLPRRTRNVFVLDSNSGVMGPYDGPFNPRTSIRFELPAAGLARL